MKQQGRHVDISLLVKHWGIEDAVGADHPTQLVGVSRDHDSVDHGPHLEALSCLVVFYFFV